MIFFVALLVSSFNSCSGDLLRGWTDLPTTPYDVHRQLPGPPSLSGPFDDGYATFTATFGDEGYMRTVRPLGSCYQTSQNGTQSSEIATHFELKKDSWSVKLRVFTDTDCSSSKPEKMKIEMPFDGVYTPGHEKDFFKTMELPEWSTGGFLWT